jgi:multiple sugar transport system substrate-binding protein
MDNQIVRRRDFLRLTSLTAGSLLVAACGGGATTPPAAPTSAPAAPTAAPTVAPKPTAAAAAPTTAPAAPTTAPAAATAAPAATTAPAAAAAGAPPTNTTATLTIFDFGGEADKKIYADAHARFKKKYPNVTIEDNFVPVTTWSEFSNKVATDVAAGHVPDIINIAIEGTRLVVKKGLIVPLDQYINNDPGGKELIADVAPALIDAFKVDGKIWQVPHSWNNMLIYYNTKLFKDANIDPPKETWTWDDFLATAKKLTTGGGDNKVYGFGIPFFNFGLTPWFLTNGTYRLTADWTDSNLNDPKVLESVKFVHDLVHVHQVSPDVGGEAGVDVNAQLFAAGKLGMSGWGHWPIQGFIQNNFKDFDVQFWPRKTAATAVHGVGGWGIAKDSSNKPLAWELIKELTSKETIQASAEAGVAIPARRSVAEGADFLKFPSNSKIFYGSLNDSKPVEAPANFNELEGIFMRYMGDIMSDASSPEEGLQAAHQELKAAMARLKTG